MKNGGMTIARIVEKTGLSRSTVVRILRNNDE